MESVTHKATSGPSTRIVSEFADDPDMRDLVAFFAAELPQRASVLAEMAAKNDWAAIRELAHQLKGAAGGYGFPTITEQARQVERMATIAEDVERLRGQIDLLADMCRRVVGPDDSN
ncbi:MAG: Hpt domain-containing protein [Phycisphaeraceae bacterium]|nr:Hpt domain-containing protein [Phycisphaeraceae bacterium]